MEPNRKIPLLVAGVIVVAVVAGTIIQRGRDTGTDTVAVAPPPETSQAGLAGPPPPASTAPNGSGRTGAREQIADQVASRSQRREELAARTRALREESEQRFASERVDPAWAPQKESTLGQIADRPQFETAGAQPRSLSVECRSSMCRIDSQFETSGQAEDWILMYMSSVGGEMPNSIVSRSRGPDGSTRVLIHGRAR